MTKAEKITSNIFLIGFMGAGKSTIAGALKDKLGMDRIEMDERIVEIEGRSISDIFAENGEDYFRDVESQLLIDLQKSQRTIVSCGGGVVVREANRDHMKKSGVIVLLTARPETILERVKDNDERPILHGNMNVEFIEGLLAKRRDLYLQAADIIVETDGKTADEISDEVIDRVIEFQS